MTEINYLVGDATSPIGDGNKIIVHVCNDAGTWNDGFVKALSAKWDAPERLYREWYAWQTRNTFLTPFELGRVIFVRVEDNTFVANMIGEHRMKEANTTIRYTAVGMALQTVSAFAIQDNASVHMPRIGCGFAGGDWEEIEPIIEQTLVYLDIPVYVYDLA